VPEEVEKAVLGLALDDPSLGQQRVSDTLRLEGIFISPGGVRSVWLRHGLQTFKKRLAALEKVVADTGKVLTENQIKPFEKAKGEKTAMGGINTEHVGYMGSQDTYYVGTIKGVGRSYQQTFIDTYSAVGFAKLYTTKHPTNAADMPNDRVIPFFLWKAPIYKVKLNPYPNKQRPARVSAIKMPGAWGISRLGSSPARPGPCAHPARCRLWHGIS
jgi:hypothetical protein